MNKETYGSDPVERDVRPYVRVRLGDGSWYDTQDPPARWRRIIGFILIAAITLWPFTLSVLGLALLYFVDV